MRISTYVMPLCSIVRNGQIVFVFGYIYFRNKNDNTTMETDPLASKLIIYLKLY